MTTRPQCYFYLGDNDDVVEVLQGESVVAKRCDEIFTEGLGPCIGVAFSWHGQGYTFHDSGIHHSSRFGDFLDEACQSLAAEERRCIEPVVAGGDMADDDDVLSSREFCVNELKARGFAAPHEAWNPDNGVQALHLDVRNDKVRVCTRTSNFESDSDEDSLVEFGCTSMGP